MIPKNNHKGQDQIAQEITCLNSQFARKLHENSKNKQINFLSNMSSPFNVYLV